MKTHDTPAVAAALRVDLDLFDRWQREFDDLVFRIGPRFARVEPRRRMAAFLRGLLAELPGTNCWSIAEHAGERDPRGMQRLLSQAVWDEDGVRDDLRNYVGEHLGDPAAVLVVDETGDVDRGVGDAPYELAGDRDGGYPPCPCRRPRGRPAGSRAAGHRHR